MQMCRKLIMNNDRPPGWKMEKVLTLNSEFSLIAYPCTLSFQYIKYYNYGGFNVAVMYNRYMPSLLTSFGPLHLLATFGLPQKRVVPAHASANYDNKN